MFMIKQAVATRFSKIDSKRCRGSYQLFDCQRTLLSMCWHIFLLSMSWHSTVIQFRFLREEPYGVVGREDRLSVELFVHSCKDTEKGAFS